MANGLRVIETDRFKEEAERLFDSANDDIRAGLVWAVAHNPFFGQQVVGTNQRVWVIYRGDFAYLAYYSVAGDIVRLESVIKRQVPIAPGPLGLET